MKLDANGNPITEEEKLPVEPEDEDVDDNDVDEPTDDEEVNDDVDTDDTEEEVNEDVDNDDDIENIQFDSRQQKKVDDIVQKRLQRNTEKVEKELSSYAGTQIDVKNGEHLDAVKLWGFLKLNPELSQQVQALIDTQINTGNYVQPDNSSNSREQELELKEARLDLKIADKVYAKNEKVIFEWAEDNDIDITDKKTLKLAYLGWKGDNANITKANKQLREQRKTQKKTNRRGAVLEGGKGRKSANIDYSKMSEVDILSTEGMSLFTKE